MSRKLGAPQISFTTRLAGAFVVTGFFIIFNSNWGKDEPQTLRYAIMQNCSMGADGGQLFWATENEALGDRWATVANRSKAPMSFLPDLTLRRDESRGSQGQGKVRSIAVDIYGCRQGSRL